MVSGERAQADLRSNKNLTAQITTTISPISEAMTGRLGARPVEDSSTSSDQPFFPHG
jgi:hypothetical protein